MPAGSVSALSRPKWRPRAIIAPTSAPQVAPEPAMPPPKAVAIRGATSSWIPLAWQTASNTDSAQLKCSPMCWAASCSACMETLLGKAVEYECSRGTSVCQSCRPTGNVREIVSKPSPAIRPCRLPFSRVVLSSNYQKPYCEPPINHWDTVLVLGLFLSFANIP